MSMNPELLVGDPVSEPHVSIKPISPEEAAAAMTKSISTVVEFINAGKSLLDAPRTHRGNRLSYALLFQFGAGGKGEVYVEDERRSLEREQLQQLGLDVMKGFGLVESSYYSKPDLKVEKTGYRYESRVYPSMLVGELAFERRISNVTTRPRTVQWSVINQTHFPLHVPKG